MTEQKITIKNGKLEVPNHPTIPFIEGDGTGPDIWAASVIVIESAVEKAYQGEKKIHWKEVLAGEKAFKLTGNWLPDETLTIFRDYLVGIKGPLTTPVGGGIRSLNVALRQELDLFACVFCSYVGGGSNCRIHGIPGNRKQRQYRRSYGIRQQTPFFLGMFCRCRRCGLRAHILDLLHLRGLPP